MTRYGVKTLLSFFVALSVACLGSYWFASWYISGNEKINNSASKLPFTSEKPAVSVTESRNKKSNNAFSYAQNIDRLLLTSPLENKVIDEITYLLLQWAEHSVKDSLWYISQKHTLNSNVYIKLNFLLLKRWASTSRVDAVGFSYKNYQEGMRLRILSKLLVEICQPISEVNDCMGALSTSYDLDEFIANIADEKMALDGQYIEAMIWADTIQNKHVRLELQDDIANTWVDDDPAAAFEWGIQENKIESIAIRAIKKLDPWLALQTAMETPVEIQSQLVSAIIQHQAVLGQFELIVRLIDSLPDASLHANLYEYYTNAWAQKDPVGAVRYLLAEPPSKNRENLLANAAKYLGEKEPELAVSLTTELHDDELRKKMLIAILTSWSLKDLPSAVSWIEQQPTSLVLDKAIARVGGMLISREFEPQDIALFVNTIGHAGLRGEMLRRIEATANGRQRGDG